MPRPGDGATGFTGWHAARQLRESGHRVRALVRDPEKAKRITAIFDADAPQTIGDSPLVSSAARYGRSKADSDAFVRCLEQGGTPIAIVYPSGIIGPDDPGPSESMGAYRGFVQAMIDSEGGTQFVDARDGGSNHLRSDSRLRVAQLARVNQYENQLAEVPERFPH